MSMRNITYVNRKGDARFRGQDKSRGGLGKPGVADWRLKPAREGSERLGWGGVIDSRLRGNDDNVRRE